MAHLVDPLACASKQHTVEKASLNDTQGCPVCGNKMVEVLASGVDSLVCLDHRIVLPALDDDKGA